MIYKSRLNKSFAGVQGAVLQKSPLPAGGKPIKIFLTLIFLSLYIIPGHLNGGETKLLKTRIVDLLALVPAETMQERDRVCAGLMKLGPAGLKEICRMLVPPGEVDDAAVRFALSGLAAYTTLERNEADRKILVRVILDVLKSNKPAEVKSFLIRQLQTCGKRESVEPLGFFLEDEKLCEPAAQALLAIRTPGVGKVFEKAFPSADGKRLVTIIKALGELGHFDITKEIKKYTYNKNPDLRWAALYALANSGDESAAFMLNKALKQESGSSRDKAFSLYLLTARRLYEKGKQEKAVGMCSRLINAPPSKENPHWQSMALSTLVSLLEDKSLDFLLTALDSPNKQYHAAALKMASAVPGPKATKEWVKKAREVQPPVRAGIIAMLGLRGDDTALPEVLQALEEDSKEVRLAAIPAAARLGKAAALPGIMEILKSGKPDEVELARDSLLTIPGEKVVSTLVSFFPRLPAVSRAAAMDIFSARLITEQLEPVFAQVESKDATARIAAIKALKNLAATEDLPRLTGIILNAKGEEEKEAVKQTVIALSNRIPGKEKRADFLLGLLPGVDGSKRCLILETLAGIGGEKALKVVVNDTISADPALKDAAIRSLTNWLDYKAAGALLEISQRTTNEEHHKLTLQSYINQAINAGLSPQKKLRMFKEAMKAARDTEEKQAILAGLTQVKLYEALDFLELYLDDPELRFAAADAAANIILPRTGKDNGLYGAKTAQRLEKAIGITRDEYLKEQCVSYLKNISLEEPAGFVPLFNGRDLSDWKGLVADPPARAKMKPAELAKLQRKADKKMRKHWKVKKGVLCFDGKGHSICTKKDYKDFEMLVDWKIGKQGDSGIYLRGSPQVQIWDPAQWPEGSGGLYNNEKHANKPLVCADNPIGQWNNFRIIMKGERVTVYLNDILAVDDVVMENYWERDKAIYPVGQIELQAHNSPLYFRGIYIREITPGRSKAGLTKEEKSAGFISLFNGSDLRGWLGNTKGYAAENGKIVLYPKKGDGNLYTEKEYTDFILRFEFKLTPGANNGLGIRAPLQGDAAYVGMELQILDNKAHIYKDLKPYQYHGSIYGVVPAKRGYQKPVGEWNYQEVIVKGRMVTVNLNGVKILDADIDEASRNGTIDGRDHPGLKRAKGHIGFLGHGSVVEFRNIRLKTLSSE